MPRCDVTPAHLPLLKKEASRIYCRRNRVAKKQETNNNEKGDGCVDLEMRLGWPRCAPAERPMI
jgi:hypothetical protein